MSIEHDLENPILQRLVQHGANGDPRSAGQIVREASGLPDAALATTLESLLRRRPKPMNPGGYVVNTLRRIRAEGGHPELEQVTISREPDL